MFTVNKESAIHGNNLEDISASFESLSKSPFSQLLDIPQIAVKP
jgi:hypothetical protein